MQELLNGNSISGEWSSSVCEELANSGLLSAEDHGKQLRFTPAAWPNSELLSNDGERRAPRVTLRHVSNLIYSCLGAWLTLKALPLIATVRWMHGRSHNVPNSLPLGGATIELTRTLIAVFRRCRPFLYSPRERCLFDSLALITFLQRYGIRPQWVFAVTTNPFGAHCWVEYEGYVLNDTPVHIKSYMPIMRV